MVLIICSFQLCLVNCLASCFFHDGYIQGSTAKKVANINNECGCAIRVKLEYPEAYGATWHLNDSCWAEFGQHVVPTSSPKIKTCLFDIWGRYFFILS